MRYVTDEAREIILRAITNARIAMRPGEDTRNAYGAGRLDALEGIAWALDIKVPEDAVTGR